MPNTQAVGVAFADPEFISMSVGVNGIGFTQSARSAVTQLTNKNTSVTVPASMSVSITTANTSLTAAGGTAVFTLNDPAISSADFVQACIVSGASPNSYSINVTAIGSGTARIEITNNSAAPLAETLLVRVIVIKAF
jgi:hypothetical protein